MVISNSKPRQNFEATILGIGQKIVHDYDPRVEGNTDDKLPIDLGILFRGTFKTASQGSGVQTESSGCRKLRSVGQLCQEDV